MAKRFTDTDKWKDEWYTELSNDYKIIWQYLLDTCDNAGIYKRNIKLLNIMCNTNVSSDDILKVLTDRLTPISDDKWFINKFCKFQYGPDFLQSKNKAVVSAVNKLIENDIYKSFFQYGSPIDTLSIEYKYPTNTPSIGYQYPMDTPKEQEQDKVKVIEEDKEMDKVEDEYEYSDRSKGNTKNITERMLDVLVDADSDDLKYNRAVDDWKELGGINEISEIMGWDALQKNNWNEKVNTIYKIKTS